MTTTTYTATAERSGKWWAVEVPDVPGAFTQGRNLKEAAEMAREAVALLLDVSEDEIEIDLQPKLPETTTTALEDFQARRVAREEAEEAERSAQETAARALLTEAGLSVRDAGVVLGISYQRVAQLAPAGEAKVRTATTTGRKGREKVTHVPAYDTKSKAKSKGRAPQDA